MLTHMVTTVCAACIDDHFDSALNEKMSGLNSREKWRVRCYNEDFSFIRLEKKSKRNNLCRKQSVRLSQQEVHSLMEGDILFMIDRKEDLLKELYFKMKSRLLRPCVIVEYTRIPFIHPAGNTRITLDSDIRTGIKNTDFFANNPLQVPTEEAYAVLEVKFDEFLPDFIHEPFKSDQEEQALSQNMHRAENMTKESHHDISGHL